MFMHTKLCMKACIRIHKQIHITSDIFIHLLSDEKIDKYKFIKKFLHFAVIKTKTPGTTHCDCHVYEKLDIKSKVGIVILCQKSIFEFAFFVKYLFGLFVVLYKSECNSNFVP